MTAHSTAGAVAPGQAASERPEKGDAREVDVVAVEPDHERARSFPLWIARDDALKALQAIEDELQSLNDAPLRPTAKRRPRRRDRGSGPAAAPTGQSIGVFTTRRSSVQAEILQRLLEGEALNGLDAVFSSDTTRLADKVFCLRRVGWPIRTAERSVRTTDGRTESVAVYTLPRATIAAAMVAGGAEFCASVREARAKRRAVAGAV